MDINDQRDYEEEEYNRAVLLEEQDYDPDLFADTWNAEPFDASQLEVPREWDELPEWMIG